MADFLDDVFPADDQEQMEAAPEVVEDAPNPEPVEEAPVEPEQPAQEPEPAPQEPEARHVPISAMLDERDKRKALEAERDRYKQELEQARQKPAQNVPDPYDDPQGFAAYQEQRVQEAVTQQRFQMSELMAKQTHGEETVNTAAQWALEKANSDPAFAAAYHRQAHPIDWIVQQHKRDAILSDIGDNVDDWFTREAAKRGYAPANVAAPAPAVAQTQQATPPAKVPRSLATQGSGPTDVRQVASGPTAAVDALFS